jgi:hypothetical protein
MQLRERTQQTPSFEEQLKKADSPQELSKLLTELGKNRSILLTQSEQDLLEEAAINIGLEKDGMDAVLDQIRTRSRQQFTENLAQYTEYLGHRKKLMECKTYNELSTELDRFTGSEELANDSHAMKQLLQAKAFETQLRQLYSKGDRFALVRRFKVRVFPTTETKGEYADLALSISSLIEKCNIQIGIAKGYLKLDPESGQLIRTTRNKRNSEDIIPVKTMGQIMEDFRVRTDEVIEVPKHEFAIPKTFNLRNELADWVRDRGYRDGFSEQVESQIQRLDDRLITLGYSPETLALYLKKRERYHLDLVNKLDKNIGEVLQDFTERAEDCLQPGAPIEQTVALRSEIARWLAKFPTVDTLREDIEAVKEQLDQYMLKTWPSPENLALISQELDAKDKKLSGQQVSEELVGRASLLLKDGKKEVGDIVMLLAAIEYWLEKHANEKFLAKLRFKYKLPVLAARQSLVAEYRSRLDVFAGQEQQN